MSRFRSLVVPTALICVLTLILVAQPGYQEVQAETAVTPTLIATAWQYLPAIRGQIEGPTVTATPPPPTRTAGPTATPSATLEATDTPEPGRLAAPVLFDIVNENNRNFFTVGWLSVPGAGYYRLQRKPHKNVWEQIYEGPQTVYEQSNLPDGQYCYRVKALDAVTDSVWSAVKCATVMSATRTATPTHTATPPGGLTAPLLADIDNADGDGNYAVEWSSVPGAHEYILKEGPDESPTDVIIYRGPNTRLDRSNMPAGQHCYRVRAIIPEGEWGPFSAFKCVTVVGGQEMTPTPEPFQCTYETVAEIKPGLVHHNLTYLEKMNVVLITGGMIYELEDPANPESVYEVPNEIIYLYDVEKRRLHTIGRLDRPSYAKRVAVPLDDNSVLIAGVYEGSEKMPDTVLHIKRLGDGFSLSQEVRQPLFADGDLTEMVIIDEHQRLLVHEIYYYYAMTTLQTTYIYNTLTGELKFRFNSENRGWEQIFQMGDGSDRFVGTIYGGVLVGDIRTGSTWEFPFPDASGPGYPYPEFWINSMTVVPLSETALLLTNGYVIAGSEDYPSLAEAHISNTFGNMRKIADTKHVIDERLPLLFDDGRVVLIGGFVDFLDVSTASEVFDPATETFQVVQGPNRPHVRGESVKLKDGTYLISGGYDEFPYAYPDDPILLTGGTLEIVTCK